MTGMPETTTQRTAAPGRPSPSARRRGPARGDSRAGRARPQRARLQRGRLSGPLRWSGSGSGRPRATDLWSRLGAEPSTGHAVPGTGIVAVAAALVGLVASIVSTRSGWNLAYADAQSHLSIARRIVDSADPGLGQLGTVWLPVPHLLLMPLTAIDVLWRTGWAACLVGIGCLAVSAAALHHIAARLGLGRAGRLAALAALLLNPSLLYAYTTALTEPVLIAAMLATIAGLARWATATRTPSGGELAVYAGVPAAAAALSRYEGWALLVTGSAFVAVVELRRRQGLRRALTRAAAFLAVPLVGIAWWLSYNAIRFGDPLAFVTGPYSARAQQQVLIDNGILPTRGNLLVSLSTYNWALLETAGLALLVLAGLGLIVAARRFRTGTPMLVVALLTTSYLFSVVSLTLGQTSISNDHTDPATWWNNRFALSVCPLLALLVGVLADARLRALARGAVFVVIIPALIGQTAWFALALPSRSAVIAEAQRSRQDAVGSQDVARYLATFYRGGDVLIDESARGNAILPVLGIPMRELITRSTGAPFDAAIADPAAHAEWILANVDGRGVGLDSGPHDLATQALARPEVLSRYMLVRASGDHALYRRVGQL